MLPKRLRKASPEEIAAYRTQVSRKAKQSTDECCTLFRQRMRRDGREPELDQRIAAYRDEGKSRRQAIFAAMRDMGYEGAAKERKYERHAQARAMITAHRKKIQDWKKRHYRRMRNKSLEEAMVKLKPNATPEQEMDWVTSHPKLFAVQQIIAECDDPTELKEELRAAMKLTPADIDPEVCPSRAAVSLLYTAMKDPDEWNRKKRDAHKSKTGAGSGGDDDTSEVADDLAEVERMLRAATEVDG